MAQISQSLWQKEHEEYQSTGFDEVGKGYLKYHTIVLPRLGRVFHEFLCPHLPHLSLPFVVAVYACTRDLILLYLDKYQPHEMEDYGLISLSALFLAWKAAGLDDVQGCKRFFSLDQLVEICGEACTKEKIYEIERRLLELSAYTPCASHLTVFLTERGLQSNTPVTKVSDETKSPTKVQVKVTLAQSRVSVEAIGSWIHKVIMQKYPALFLQLCQDYDTLEITAKNVNEYLRKITNPQIRHLLTCLGKMAQELATTEAKTPRGLTQESFDSLLVAVVLAVDEKYGLLSTISECKHMPPNRRAATMRRILLDLFPLAVPRLIISWQRTCRDSPVLELCKPHA